MGTTRGHQTGAETARDGIVVAASVGCPTAAVAKLRLVAHMGRPRGRARRRSGSRRSTRHIASGAAIVIGAKEAPRRNGKRGSAPPSDHEHGSRYAFLRRSRALRDANPVCDRGIGKAGKCTRRLVEPARPASARSRPRPRPRDAPRSLCCRQTGARPERGAIARDTLSYGSAALRVRMPR